MALVGSHQDAEEITRAFKDTKAADYFIITGVVRITFEVVVVQSEAAAPTNTQTVLDCSSLRKWGSCINQRWVAVI